MLFLQWNCNDQMFYVNLVEVLFVGVVTLSHYPTPQSATTPTNIVRVLRLMLTLHSFTCLTPARKGRDVCWTLVEGGVGGLDDINSDRTAAAAAGASWIPSYIWIRYKTLYLLSVLIRSLYKLSKHGQATLRVEKAGQDWLGNLALYYNTLTSAFKILHVNSFFKSPIHNKI